MVEADSDTSDSSGADAASTTSSSQSSGAQTGKAGYPAVDKWESGITRGPANPIGVTKWSDVVGAKLTRGHANPLNEQPEKTSNSLNQIGQTLKNVAGSYVNTAKNVVSSIGDMGNKVLSHIKPEFREAAWKVLMSIPVGKGALASEYPKCFGLDNKNLAEIQKQPDGRYYVAIKSPPAYAGFDFTHTECNVPMVKWVKYTCGKSNYPEVDGHDFVAENWAKEKDKYVTDWERNEIKKIERQQAQLEKIGDFYQKYHHEVNMVLGIAAVFIPFVGSALSAGIGAIDAKQYYDEGDTKTAGMIMMFALLPGIGKVVSKIPGVKTLGPKLMAELGKKLSLGSKAFSPAEIEVVTQISQYKNLITQEIAKVGEATAKQSVKKELVKQAVKQKIKQKAVSAGKTAAAYTAAGVAYSKGYDKIVGTPKAQDYVDRVTHSTEPPVIYKEEDMEKDENGNWVPK